MRRLKTTQPRATRITFITLLVGAAIGSLLIYFGDDYVDALGRWLLAEPELTKQRFVAVLIVIGLLFSAPLLVFSRHFWLIGAGTIANGRFPPESCRLLRKMTVLYGIQAVQKGRMMKILAWFIVMAALGMIVMLSRLAVLIVAGIEGNFA